MNILEKTKQLCKQCQIKPARSRGQNFLIKEDVYRKVIAAAELKPDDIVLEVGPGFGFLTELLARKVKQVVAVEVDSKLAEVLRERLEEQEMRNVEVVNENILRMSKSKLFQIIPNQIQNLNVKGKKTPDKSPPHSFLNQRKEGYKIVANLPYNITSRFLRQFLSEVEMKPSLMVLMLQQEVAERICAGPGQMSLLAVATQFYSEPKIIAYIPADDFWPKPKVESAIITLTPRFAFPLSRSAGEGAGGEGSFFKLVKIGFSAKRKQLQGNLAKGLEAKAEDIKKILKECGLLEIVRAQELSLADWQKLYVVLARRNML